MQNEKPVFKLNELQNKKIKAMLGNFLNVHIFDVISVPFERRYTMRDCAASVLQDETDKRTTGNNNSISVLNNRLNDEP